MSLGSKNRDYKTSARSIKVNLDIHHKYMMIYISEGMSKEEASKKVYDEIIEGLHSKEIKKAIKNSKF